MDTIFTQSAALAKVQFRYDDDTIDRLNHLFTGGLFVIFSIIVSTSYISDESLVCWGSGPSYSDSQKGYITNYCWVSNTWWRRLNEPMPIDDVPVRRGAEIAYYQWVPFILLLMALFFYLPCLVWRALADTSSIHIKDIVDEALKTTVCSQADRKATMDNVTYHIDVSLRTQRRHKRGTLFARATEWAKCCLLCGRRYGNFLFISYVIVKLLYIANLVAQTLILNRFLQMDRKSSVTGFYGFDLVDDMFRGKSWQVTGIFPRVTYCDFEVRVLGNLHRHTVQCVLPINLFNEKIFVLIWFWMFLLSIFTILSLIMWLIDIGIPSKHEMFIRKYLKRQKEESSKAQLRRFVGEYLRTDGIFVLTLIKRNTGELMITDLVKSLWEHYKEREKDAVNSPHDV